MIERFRFYQSLLLYRVSLILVRLGLNVFIIFIQSGFPEFDCVKKKPSNCKPIGFVLNNVIKINSQYIDFIFTLILAHFCTKYVSRTHIFTNYVLYTAMFGYCEAGQEVGKFSVHKPHFLEIFSEKFAYTHLVLLKYLRMHLLTFLHVPTTYLSAAKNNKEIISIYIYMYVQEIIKCWSNIHNSQYRITAI